MEKLEDRSIFNLVKIRETIRSFQLVETNNIIKRINELLFLRMIKELNAVSILGKLFYINTDTCNIYLLFDKLRRDGSFLCEVVVMSKPRDKFFYNAGKKIVNIVDYQIDRNIWNIYMNGQKLDIIEVKEEESDRLLTKYFKNNEIVSG